MLYKNQNRWQIDKGNLEQLTYIHVDCRMSNHCFRGPQENLIGGKDFRNIVLTYTIKIMIFR